MIRIYEILWMHPIVFILLMLLLVFLFVLPLTNRDLGSYLMGNLNDCPDQLKVYWRSFHTAKWTALVLIGCSVLAYKLGM